MYMIIDTLTLSYDISIYIVTIDIIITIYDTYNVKSSAWLPGCLPKKIGASRPPGLQRRPLGSALDVVS